MPLKRKMEIYTCKSCSRQYFSLHILLLAEHWTSHQQSLFILLIIENGILIILIKIRVWDLQHEHVRWLNGLNWSQLGCTVAYMCRCPTSEAEASLGQLRVTGWQTEWNQGSQGLRENVCSHGLNVASQWTHPFIFWFR